MVSKRATAVARILLDIFSLFGPPSILQSYNGHEFSGAAPDTQSLRLSDEVRKGMNFFWQFSSNEIVFVLSTSTKWYLKCAPSGQIVGWLGGLLAGLQLMVVSSVWTEQLKVSLAVGWEWIKPLDGAWVAKLLCGGTTPKFTGPSEINLHITSHSDSYLGVGYPTYH